MWPVAYPDQTEFPPTGEKRFDSESIFWLRGSLYVMTKWRLASGFPLDGTALYRVDKPVNGVRTTLVRLGEKGGLGGWVTSAAASANGGRVAVLTHLPTPGVWILDARIPARMLERPLRHYQLDPAMGQVEAIAWTADGVLTITNEPGTIWRFRVEKGRMTSTS